MTQAEWMDIAEAVDVAVPANHERGVLVELLLSAYDFPEAFRSRYDEKLRRYVIEFRYLDDEPSLAMRGDEHVVFLIGKYTKRLKALQLDVDALKVDRVDLAVKKEADDALGRLVSSEGKGRQNYEIARKLITDKWKDLVPGLGTLVHA